MPVFEAYLEGFHEISVLSSKNYAPEELEQFTVKGENETLLLTLIEKKRIDDVMKYTLHFNGYIFLNKSYHVHDHRGQKTELFSGEIVRTELFDELFYYDGDDLGFTYDKEKTIFKAWTPVAKSVDLILISQDGEETVRPFSYQNEGVWQVVVEGDLDGQAYLLEAYVNGRKNRFNDPYAIASAANGRHNYVVDIEKFHQMENKRPFSGKTPCDAFIYEASIRDFTMDDTIGAKYPGKFLGVIETGLKSTLGTKAGFDYLKDLGLTHVQLLPFYDFEGVDETKPEKKYNWGYNPSQYNVPEGSFSTDPDDPYARINEMRKMIDTLHGENLGVVMDVVYNHVYDSRTFSLGKMVPGYAYRTDHNGVLTNASGCGNDLATDHKMIRKFIVDSVLFWTDVHKVDGFRFDLMGLIDTTTMHVVRQKLESRHPQGLLYGEGWQMSTRLPARRMAHMNNPRLLYNIGFFNDMTRDYIKGATFNIRDKGFTMGSTDHLGTVARIIRAKTHKEGAIKYPGQSINYVECHDNHTFHDKTGVALKEKSAPHHHKVQKLATAMVVLMQGVPFIHMGQEFYRSKKGVENSYKSPDSINKVTWYRAGKHQTDIEDLKRLIAIRKEHDLFRLKTPYDIDTKTHVRFKESGSILYELKDEAFHLVVIFKNNQQEETFTFDEAFDIIYNSEHKHEDKTVDTLTLEDISTTILRLESGKKR